MQQKHQAVPSMRVTALLPGPIRSLLLPFEPAIQKVLGFDELVACFRSGSAGSGESLFADLLSRLEVECQVSPADLARVPATGPAVVVVNHPFGFLEGAILAATLPKVRKDFKIVANSLLAGFAELGDSFIFVNPFGGKQAVHENRRPLRECLSWLRAGGMLVIFPAGEVAHLSWRERSISDPAWHPNVARLIQRAGSTAVPVYFAGANSVPFHLAG